MNGRVKKKWDDTFEAINDNDCVIGTYTSREEAEYELKHSQKHRLNVTQVSNC